MPARLYVVPASHPCAVATAALELKGIPYERVDLIPVVHKLVQLARFGAATVPGIEFADGVKVVGSRHIVRALDARRPDPPLLPAGEEERRRVERAEKWGDEVLQPVVRRLSWAALVRDPQASTSYAEGARLGVPAPLARLTAPLLARAEVAIQGAHDPVVRADLLHLDSHLRRIEDWIAAGVLGGEQPNAADLQIASSLRLALTFGDLRPRIDGRPAGELARRWFEDYPGETPAGALPAAWLAAGQEWREGTPSL